jgi:proteasome lid subunit RPN8/RPN11
MIEHALQEAPNECCGVLLGKNDTIDRVIAMRSDPPAPDAYFMDPLQQVEVFTEMEKRGESLLGIYHSHPKGPAEPSGVDLQLAFHPDAVYFIVSLADPTQPEVRAFMLRSGKFQEVQIELTA